MTLSRRKIDQFKVEIRKSRRTTPHKGEAAAVPPSPIIEAVYYKDLLKLVDRTQKFIERITAKTKKLFAKKEVENAFVKNALPASLVSEFDKQLKALEAFAATTAITFATNNDKYNKSAFIKSIDAALGVNIDFMLSDKRAKQRLEKAVSANIKLIKSIPAEHMERAKKAIEDALLKEGSDYESLVSQLQEIEGITQRRARLIAIDQNAKLNADLNNVRQEDIGVTKFRWITQNDKKVRSRHRKLKNRVFTIKEGASVTLPNGKKIKIKPGEEVRCRCRQQPDISHLKKFAMAA